MLRLCLRDHCWAHYSEKKISGFPRQFLLSGERWLKKGMSVKKKLNRLFFPFSQSSSAPDEGERYLYSERLLVGNQDFLLLIQWDMVMLSEACQRNLFKILYNLVSSVKMMVMVFATRKSILVRINCLWDAETQIWRPWEAAWSIQIKAALSLCFALL